MVGSVLGWEQDAGRGAVGLSYHPEALGALAVGGDQAEAVAEAQVVLALVGGAQVSPVTLWFPPHTHSVSGPEGRSPRVPLAENLLKSLLLWLSFRLPIQYHDLHDSYPRGVSQRSCSVGGD